MKLKLNEALIRLNKKECSEEDYLKKFEKLPMKKIASLLSGASVVNLPSYLPPILRAAGYYETKAKQNADLFEKALACYALVSQSISAIPLESVTKQLSILALKTDFSLLHVPYLKARCELHTLTKQMESDNDRASRVANLKNIKGTITRFEERLKKSYKDPGVKFQLNLSNQLVSDVESDLTLVSTLLTPEAKRKPPALKEQSKPASKKIKSSLIDESSDSNKNTECKIPDSLPTTTQFNNDKEHSNQTDAAHLLTYFFSNPTRNKTAETPQTPFTI